MPNPFAARVKRQTTEAQSLSPLEQFVGRIQLLGATDEEIAQVRETWDELDEQWTAEDRDNLANLSDDDLRAELLATREEYDHATTTEDEQDQRDAATWLEQVRAEAAEVIGQNVGQVLGWVGEDAGRALAILELEQSESGAKRKGVVEPLTEMVAGETTGIPVEFVGEVPQNIDPDELAAAGIGDGTTGEGDSDGARGGADEPEPSPDVPDGE